MKKVYLSPVTSLLMSLSLALGILVSDLSGYKFLTSAHAEENPCGGSDGGTPVITSTVFIADGVTSGIVVRDLVVNGALVGGGVIASTVQLLASDVVEANGALVGGGINPTPNGALVGGGDNPNPSGSNEAGETPCFNGALVGGGDNPTPNGALVGGGIAPTSDEVTVSGAVVSASGTFSGGTLTGDDIVISGGVITGRNLVLNGATLDGGSISGTVTSVSVSPSN